MALEAMGCGVDLDGFEGEGEAKSDSFIMNFELDENAEQKSGMDKGASSNNHEAEHGEPEDGA
eukprot:4355836-Alexandrium_andersonii.AAC.1